MSVTDEDTHGESTERGRREVEEETTLATQSQLRSGTSSAKSCSPSASSPLSPSLC